MSLYEEWENSITSKRTDEEYNQYWKDYFQAETENYRKILEKHDTVIEGTFTELSEYFNMDTVTFTGFLDGINSSLANGEIDVRSITEESYIELKVDFEKLYYNMHVAKADWLYNLKEWDNILSELKRKEITKDYHNSLIYKASIKVGRNDPCPCGSGKKYKKCCGK